MKDSALSTLAMAAYSTSMAVIPATEISDITAIVIAASSGLFGGVVAAMLGKEPLYLRGFVVTVMASIMFSVAMVYGLMIYPHDGDVRLTALPVFGVSMISGLFAWLIFSKLVQVLQGTTVAQVREMLIGLVSGIFGGRKGPPS